MDALNSSGELTLSRVIFFTSSSSKAGSCSFSMLFGVMDKADLVAVVAVLVLVARFERCADHGAAQCIAQFGSDRVIGQVEADAVGLAADERRAGLIQFLHIGGDDMLVVGHRLGRCGGAVRLQDLLHFLVHFLIRDRDGPGVRPRCPCRSSAPRAASVRTRSRNWNFSPRL